jgi:lambda family phage portal protein
MGLISALFGPVKRPSVAMPVHVRARFDSAEKGDDYRHWQNSDALSADAAGSPMVRRTLRNRARYERANNSYLAGISSTIANDLIGTGPRLQLNSGDSTIDREIERAFFDWGWQINLPTKLRTMRECIVTDGEAFAMFISNPANDGVQLDVRLVEAEMISTPTQIIAASTTVTPEGSIVDGLEFDQIGNVLGYQLLNYHPGSNWKVNNLEYTRIPASQIVHWYRPQRAGQHRGIPEVGPALKLFAAMRRYTEAVIAAAETAADFAAFLHSNSPAAEVDEVDAFSEMAIEKRSMVTLPEGWDISQLKAEQPTNTYQAFKREIVSEIGRCMQLPYNVAALDSSSYNYASGRMDHQIYAATVRVYRDELERVMLDRMLGAWVAEASLLGIVPDSMAPISEWNWSWVWDGREHVDPSKEAEAARTRLETLTTSLAHEYAKQGKNWETELRQIAAERTLIGELGLSVAVAAGPTDLTGDQAA